MTIRAGSRGRHGQTIYQLMLIIACVALAVAAFFPTFDYITTYRGAVEGGDASALRPGLAAPPAGAGQTPTTTMPTPGDTTSTTVPAAAPEAPAAPAAGGGA